MTGSAYTEKDWQRVKKHAAPRAIEAYLKAARQARDRAQRVVDRWEALLSMRLAQVAAGEWPPPVERVTWRELRPGDVLADPDRDLPVTETGTEARPDGEWVTVRYDNGDGTYWHRSAPADREAVILPRAGTGERTCPGDR